MRQYDKFLCENGNLAIYLFHGVVEETNYLIRNYTKKHLSKKKFREVMESVGRHGTPMSMDEVLEYCLDNRPFPKNAFAVTFDDGFENNITVAKPILEDLGIPATVYVTSHFIDENAMSWIDRIEWAFETTKSGVLLLPWRDVEEEIYDTATKILRLDEIRKVVKSDPTINVDKLVSSIFQQLDIEEIFSSCEPIDQKMSWEQVRAWVGSGFLVGGHSHTHKILSFLPLDELAKELDISLKLLKDKSGIISPHYSYPEGLAHCISTEVIDALKDRGIKCSPTAIEGINPPGSDPFSLKRIIVGS